MRTTAGCLGRLLYVFGQLYFEVISNAQKVKNMKIVQEHPKTLKQRLLLIKRKERYPLRHNIYR